MRAAKAISVIGRPLPRLGAFSTLDDLMTKRSATYVAAAVVALTSAACISTPPPHPRALEANELCARYIGMGDLVHAEVQCDLGLQFAPQYADLWVNKGLIELKRGNNALAKDHFIKALRYNQEQSQAYNNLGYIYYKDHAYGKAHDNFQRALKVNPDYTEARYNLALTYKDMGEKEKAKKELRTIIAINDLLADPHAQLGAILHQEGELAEAVEHLKAAVQRDPNFEEAWLELGNTYMDMGSAAEAQDAYEMCLQANKSSIECKNNLPLSRKKAALQEPSLQNVKEAAAGLKTAAGEYALARNYREKGLRTEEKRAYHRCLKYDVKYALCHYGLYEIYFEDRNEKDAKAACQNFLKFAEANEHKAEVENCERFVSANTF